MYFTDDLLRILKHGDCAIVLSSYTETVADPESETVLCCNSKHVFLPVEIGDKIVRLLTNEDIKLYGRADEYAGFDGS